MADKTHAGTYMTNVQDPDSAEAKATNQLLGLVQEIGKEEGSDEMQAVGFAAAAGQGVLAGSAMGPWGAIGGGVLGGAAYAFDIGQSRTKARKQREKMREAVRLKKIEATKRTQSFFLNQYLSDRASILKRKEAFREQHTQLTRSIREGSQQYETLATDTGTISRYADRKSRTFKVSAAAASEGIYRNAGRAVARLTKTMNFAKSADTRIDKRKGFDKKYKMSQAILAEYYRTKKEKVYA